MNVVFRTTFARDLKKIKDQIVLDAIDTAIERAEKAKSPADLGNLKKMEAAKNCYRIRVGDYRIGVVIEGDTVAFARCLNRRDIYRKFP
jgi:mRNA interferase RelE/StbE